MDLSLQDGLTFALWALSIGAALVIAFKAPPLFILYKAYLDAEGKEADRQRLNLAEFRQAISTAKELSARDLRHLRWQLSEVYHPASWATSKKLSLKDSLTDDDRDLLISAVSADEATSLPFWRRFRWAAKEILAKFWFSKAVTDDGAQKAIPVAASTPAVAVRIPHTTDRVRAAVAAAVPPPPTKAAEANA